MNRAQRKRHTTAEALRMVGHLLLHHSTHGSYANDDHGKEASIIDPQAASWCLIGASYLVAQCLRTNLKEMLRVIESRIPAGVQSGETQQGGVLIQFWDRHLGGHGRLAFAEGLSTYGL